MDSPWNTYGNGKGVPVTAVRERWESGGIASLMLDLHIELKGVVRSTLRSRPPPLPPNGVHSLRIAQPVWVLSRIRKYLLLSLIQTSNR